MEDSKAALLSSAAGAQWQLLGIKPHHGINIPLFSLHSSRSSGIGEYTDLIPLIDWCSSAGFDTIQLLPLNDPGLDKSPYNALSSFALNPLYIGLSQLPYLEHHPDLRELLTDLKALNELPYVDYVKVREGKKKFLKIYWEREYGQFAKTVPYLNFVNQTPRLKGYALFKTLKERFGYSYWKSWPEAYRTYSSDMMDQLLVEESAEYSYYNFLQYLCHVQLQQAKQVAEAKGVHLMGDIPILISPDSADVWHYPELFDQELSAGAPPDYYNLDGQNWGFPIYNWEEMEKHHYAWWNDRLSYASNYYHLYRIDHIVGFFRIWAIPPGNPSSKGFFSPSDPTTWIDHGKKIMEMMIKASSMLPIGEDLGTVPPDVRLCLRQLGICGTKVMRWERDWNKDKTFIPFNQYPLESLTTVSTHDSETLAQWWVRFPNEAKEYCQFKGWDYEPVLSYEKRMEMLRDSHETNSIFHINLLQEYLALFSELVWEDIDKERINVPGKILTTNWSYKFKPSIEELISHSGLKNALQDLLKSNS